ncbi:MULTISPECIES: HlyD family efflux transporter periplasmic adaptor subunit [unclassified Pseudoalteromonas]|uniref:efflux RND transporter periplasmic adaptor subunit n=1 Tax=unclassified Pseudoalteromonas TaxID=194690 RepID=UPI00209803CB|nr:HlyD family efflux transporter periplasmic adaptor subunit [Pseudoalteromonas sp. XMcav2-N]MCO7190440.1 HlyD family efflux transporter periplasmic adaptor subunit [Pseudoalteromonas sp. XMcav2-N]
MDIVKKQRKAWYKHKSTFIVAALFGFLTLLFVISQQQFSAFSVERGTLLTAIVQRGEFSIKVAAPGTLVPEDIRWVASNVTGKVERILVKPGAEVNAGDLIVELSNPELKQQLDELNWEYTALEAELEALAVSHQSEKLEMQALLLKTQMQYDKAKLRLDAEEDLIKQGNATVSRLDYEDSKLTVTQLAQTLRIDKSRQLQLAKNLQASYKARRARLAKLHKAIEQAQFQLTSLQITAPLDGIVQAMPLELGQRVALGQNIAKFAHADELIAELKVPQIQAANIALGQSVEIDTRFNTITGKVTRIDPAVVNGTVQVDVELLGDLPNEARPDLSIDGAIIIRHLNDALYVKRPAFSQPDQTMNILKLDAAQQFANKTQVQFGKASSLEIEILAGLQAGDTIIVSDQEQFAHHSSIALH